MPEMKIVTVFDAAVGYDVPTLVPVSDDNSPSDLDYDPVTDTWHRPTDAPKMTEEQLFEKAREDGVFGPASDCCPTWYATVLRSEGWMARAKAIPMPDRMHIPPWQAEITEVCYAEGWNQCLDAMKHDAPAPDPMIITVTSPGWDIDQIERACVMAEVPPAVFESILIYLESEPKCKTN